MIRRLLLTILLLPSFALAIDYEANVKALSPTSWCKGYYGHTVVSNQEVSDTKDFSGNSRTWTTAAAANRPKPTLADSAENFVPYSEAFGSWTNNNTTVTSDAIANPINGIVDADHLAATANNASRYISLEVYDLTVGTYITSIYVKADTAAYAQLKLSDGTTNKYTNLEFASGTCTTTAGTTCSVETLSGGWYRIIQSWTNPATNTTGNIQICPNAGTGDNCATSNGVAIYAWGAQVRKSTSSSRYVSNSSGRGKYPGVNGLPALHFDGNDDKLYRVPAMSDLFGLSAKTVYFVFRSRAVTSGYLLSQNVNKFGIYFSADSKLNLFNIDAGGTDVDQTGVVTAGAAHIFIGKHDGTKLYTALDSTTFSSGTASGASVDLGGAPALFQDRATFTQYVNGELIEMITFNTAHNATQVQTVYDYLTWVLNNPWKRVEVTP